MKKANTAGEKAKGQNFLHGAAILTVGVVIMKVLGAVYKIPIGNILGDEGYSMFISAYNIYNIFFILTTAGLPIALYRLVAEADANGRAKQEQKLFRVALILFAAVGTVFALIMFFGNEWLADNYLENPDAALSIRAMSPAILLVCLVSAYRGYCQGNGNMIPTTIDEVLEVLFKVIAGLIFSTVILKAGLGLPMASAGAVLGVAVGGVVSLAFMVFYKRRNYAVLSAPHTGGADPNDDPDDDDTVDTTGKIVSDLVRIGIPIAIGSCIMAILNSVDSKLCMNRLQSAAGFSYLDAKVLYGVYGKAQTLFNLPAAFITPLTISVVPAIASALAKGNESEAGKVSSDSMRISAVLSLPMGVGLAVLSFSIMNVIYPGSHESGPALLAVMGIASFFVCIVLMENAILQASGKEKLPMYSMVTGSIVKIIVNWFLVAKPNINIYGAPVGTLAGYAVMAAMNYVFMCRTLRSRPSIVKIFSRPGLSCAVMGAAAWCTFKLMQLFIGTGTWLKTACGMCAAILVAVAVYVFAVVKLKAVNSDDMKLIPGGEKVARLLHMT